MRLAPMVILVPLIGSAHAEGDALVDSLGPREIAVGEAMRGAATGASAIGLNPAGLPLNRELVFEGGYGYRLADEASLFGVSACDSTNAAPGCFYYQYAGSNPELEGVQMSRRSHVGGMAVAYPVTPRIFLGSNLKYFNFSSTVPGEMKTDGFNWDFGGTARITELINVGVAGYNLWGAESPEFARAIGTGVLARPIPSLALSFDARWKLSGEDHSMRYGGGAEFFLRTGSVGFPLRAGALRDNSLDATYLSAGAGFAHMRFTVDLAARQAISGPKDTMFIASMRFYGPRLRSPGVDTRELEE